MKSKGGQVHFDLENVCPFLFSQTGDIKSLILFKRYYIAKKKKKNPKNVSLGFCSDCITLTLKIDYGL